MELGDGSGLGSRGACIAERLVAGAVQVSCDALKSLIVGLSASVGSAGEGVDGEGDIGSSA